VKENQKSGENGRLGLLRKVSSGEHKRQLKYDRSYHATARTRMYPLFLSLRPRATATKTQKIIMADDSTTSEAAKQVRRLAQSNILSKSCTVAKEYIYITPRFEQAR